MSFVFKLFALHAYAVLFGWVLIEQGGVPIPSVPLMLAAGGLSAAHKLHIAYALPLILVACLISDSAWYWLGRRYGGRVLEVLCRFSLEAATCVTRTQGMVTRRGAVTLLFSKFVPGLGTMAAPITGQAEVPYTTFLFYEVTGSLIWAGGWLFAGRFLGDLLKKSHMLFQWIGQAAGVLVVLAIVGLLLYRIVKRQRFRAELRGLRLEPQQLLAMVEDARRVGAELPFIVDLRHPLDVLTDPVTLPGALRIGSDDLKVRQELIPRDRDIVLYCTCPSEETSAKVAMELRRMGIRRVRPLRGGLQGWKDAGFPLEQVEMLVPEQALTQIV